MNTVKVGDKVRFLNTTGGGIVRSFKGKDQVLVEDEDGFEVPALIRECVVVGGGNEMQVHSSNRPKMQPQAQVQQSAPKPQPKPEEVKIEETPEGERMNIYLAYLPLEPTKVIQQSGYEAYFINDSNYYLFFNYMNRHNNSWISRYNGLIEPNTKIFLEEFGKEDLNDLERICIQAIAYKKEKAFKQKNPISVEHRVDTVKFYKLHSFRENDYFDEDALIFPIVRNDIPERSFIIDPAEIEIAIKQKKDSEKPERQVIKRKHRPINEPLEIDLHINELLDTTAGMSNSDILQYQLQKVREILNEHKNEKGRKIIFIHGKGDGVLRNALITELKTKYKTFYYQDASFREYGYGATQVTIR